MSTWQQEYKRKLISAEEAAEKVKSGDLVAFTAGREAHAVGLAIAARKDELKGVTVSVGTPTFDFGWYDEGWQDSFSLKVIFPTDTCQEAMDAGRIDIDVRCPISPVRGFHIPDKAPDVVITEVSAPDGKGFCSFGLSLWDKKRLIEYGKLAIAEVNSNLPRTYGDNFIHVSDIDFFVEHTPTGRVAGMGSLGGRALKEPEQYQRDITAYVRTLIRDGDTIQIGVGRTSEPLVRLGLLDGKHDIGVHSEATPPGIINLVKEGVITGRCKTVNPGRVVVTTLGGGTKEEIEWACDNPLFWLVDVDYLEDIRVIAAHDNMVAINNALAVDFGGQINSLTADNRMLGALGGQVPFTFGALLSKGGRSITVLPSTAKGGKVSRIMPRMPEGTIISTLRACADYVVTEYGIASLWGKTLSQRAQELISIAHPDFRAELKKQAQKLL